MENHCNNGERQDQERSELGKIPNRVRATFVAYITKERHVPLAFAAPAAHPRAMRIRTTLI